MRQLRPRPNLDQLRRQARELLRAARADDPAAAALLSAIAPTPTLSAARHALARDYGFESWPKLKDAVEQRLGSPPSFLMRYVRTPDELRVLFEAIYTILGGDPQERARAHWRVFERFGEQRRLMLVLEHDGRIVGGTITLKLIAVEPWAQGIGLGRRLWQTVEGEALCAGQGLPGRSEWAQYLGTHADPENKGFFLRLGYSDHGRGGRHMRKGVPASRLLELRMRRWRERVGDLERGVVLTPDPQTGRIAPLPW